MPRDMLDEPEVIMPERVAIKQVKNLFAVSPRFSGEG